MNRLRTPIDWTIALVLLLALIMPTSALAVSAGSASAISTPAMRTDDDAAGDAEEAPNTVDPGDDDDFESVGTDENSTSQDDAPDSADEAENGNDDSDEDNDDVDDDIDDEDDDIDEEHPLAPIPPVLGDDDQIDRPIVGQGIVRLVAGVDPTAFANRFGASVLRSLPGPNIAQLQFATPFSGDLTAIQNDPDVIWFELNYTSHAPEGQPRYFFTSAAGDPRIVDQPALPRELRFSLEKRCVRGDSIIVAVLDTGIDMEHPALASAVLPNGVNMAEMTYDVGDTGNGRDDDKDGRVDEMVGHGTHVAGTILQVAPDASILPVKVLGSDGVGDTFSVMAGMYYAVEQGADIINLSLGSTFDSMAIRSGVEFAREHGLVIVAAAGNSGREQPSEFPAAIPSVISVAAVTGDGDKAPYSNFGATIDISAPGNDIASAYPGGLYTTASGTSMSAPLVSGTVALMLAVQPDLAPDQVIGRIQETAAPLHLSNPSMDGLMGAGILDIDASIDCG